MKPLSRLELKSAPDWQKARLARWLSEWEIELALQADSVSHLQDDERPAGAGGMEAGVEPSVDTAEVAPFDSDVSAGQIRLLAPGLGTEGERPLYVAVLREASEHQLVAVPYGFLAEPAVPGEMLTRRAVAGLRVLCLWNARCLHRDSLGKSWVVDNLTSDEIDEFRTACDSIRSTGRLPVALEGRGGVPLTHGGDPRHEYLYRETALMDRVAGGSQVEFGGPGPLRYPEASRDDLLMAAESPEEYDAEGEDDPGRSPADPQ